MSSGPCIPDAPCVSFRKRCGWCPGSGWVSSFAARPGEFRGHARAVPSGHAASGVSEGGAGSTPSPRPRPGSCRRPDVAPLRRGRGPPWGAAPDLATRVPRSPSQTLRGGRVSEPGRAFLLVRAPCPLQPAPRTAPRPDSTPAGRGVWAAARRSVRPRPRQLSTQPRGQLRAGAGLGRAAPLPRDEGAWRGWVVSPGGGPGDLRGAGP